MNICILIQSFKYLVTNFKTILSLASWINISDETTKQYYSFSKFERSLDLEDYEITQLLLTFVTYSNKDKLNELLAASFDRRYKYLYTRIKLLLQAGADAYESILVQCCRRGFDNIVKMLLQYNIEIKCAENALIEAIEFDRHIIVKLLYKYGVKIYDYTIDCTIRNNQIEMIKTFIEIGVNMNYSDDRAIKIAIDKHRLEIIELLLQNGVDYTNLRAVAYSLFCQKKDSIIKLLIRFDIMNEILLSEACSLGNIEIVELLLQNGTKSLNPDIIIDTYERGYAEIVKLLIQYQHNMHVQDGKVLIIACIRNDFDIVKLLLERGADVHAQNDEALLEACSRNNIKTVKLLLEHGADVHAQNDKALLEACNRNNIKTVKLLLEHGADLYKNKLDTILEKVKRNKELVNLLLEYDSKE